MKKAEALLLLWRDFAPEIVAEFVDREPSTLKDWVLDWERQRMASLFSGHAGNLTNRIVVSTWEQSGCIVPNVHDVIAEIRVFRDLIR